MDEAVDLLVELLLGGAALGAGGDNPRRGGLRDDGQGFAAAHYQKEEEGKQEGLLPEAETTAIAEATAVEVGCVALKERKKEGAVGQGEGRAVRGRRARQGGWRRG